MRVLRRTVITDINHEDLVNLFSTALTGSDMLGCDYDRDFWGLIDPEKREGDCLEDKIADTLLNGGTIYMYDYYANGETYNGRGELIDENEDGDGDGMYPITMKDIIDGLQKAANGEFNSTDADEKKAVADAFERFLREEEDGEFDLYDAETLMQIVMFNEVIYA